MVYLWQMPVLVLMETRLGHDILLFLFFSTDWLDCLNFLDLLKYLYVVNYCKLFCKIKMSSQKWLFKR